MQFIIKILVAVLVTLSLQAKEVPIENKIASLYISFFNRAPDETGLSYWNTLGKAAELRGEDPLNTLKQLSVGFATHPTFTSTYASMGNEDFVKAVYENSLGNEGDVEGIAYWTELLNNGVSRSDMVADFMSLSLTTDIFAENYPTLSEGELNAAQGRQTVIANKVLVAIYFTQTLGEATNVVESQNPENDPAYLASKEVLTEVGFDKTSVRSAVVKIAGLENDACPINTIVHYWNILEESKVEALTLNELKTLIQNYRDNPTTENAHAIVYADTSDITDMSSLFRDNKNFNLDISNWNTSKVINMDSMFTNALSFNQDVGYWDTSKVTNMNYMFNSNDETSFNQDLSDWDVGNVGEYEDFNDGTISDGNLPDFDGSNNPYSGVLTNEELRNLTGLYINNSSVKEFEKLIINADTSKVTDMSGLFKYSSFNLDISGWDTSNVTDMSEMFNNALSFNQNIKIWDTSNVTNMDMMFQNAVSFNNGGEDLGSWNVTNVTDMSNMFSNADNFNVNIGNWNVSNVSDMEKMFYLNDKFNQNISDWDVGNVKTYNSFADNSVLQDSWQPNFP